MSRIAVVGAGITGLSAAWLLSQGHEVVLYERDDRLGGHSNTVDVAAPEGLVPVDTGFIVYNVASYPNLVALFDHLGVATAATSMSFAVSLDRGGYEYAGTDLVGLFGQPANLLRPDHWRMTFDILRFFREAQGLATAGGVGPASLGDWLSERRYSRAFVARHILPMGAAIWSTPADRILAFPASAFARFFANHGLLQVRNRPLWRTVRGGSRAYVERLVGAFRGTVRQDDPVTEIVRTETGVTVRSTSGEAHYDACVMGCHADTALALLADADDAERGILGAFTYSSNDAVLHTDPALMPRRRRVWSAWNYLGDGAEGTGVTYWMNRLQPLLTATDYFVTLNPAIPIAPRHVIARFRYEHPQFDRSALTAQQELSRLQGRRRTWFAGAYCGYGFHEDGLQAGLAVAEDLGGIRRPWRVVGERSRVAGAVAAEPPGLGAPEPLGAS